MRNSPFSLGVVRLGLVLSAIGLASSSGLAFGASSAAAKPRAASTCSPTAGFQFCTRYLYDADQTFTVPANVSSIEARLWGAGGGGPISAPNGKGGGGGFITGMIAVASGQQLTITTGQPGASASGGSVPRPGGGAGGTSQNTAGTLLPGGGGGGLTAIWNGPNGTAPLLIAGAGGGAPSTGPGQGGGGGGGLAGTAGTNTASGAAGTQSQGGAAGVAPGAGCVASGLQVAGSQYKGGKGGSGLTASQGGSGGGGGGGGAGYFGGGGGACGPTASDNPGGGGGGSSYADPAAVTAVRMATGGIGTATPGATAGGADPLYDVGSGVFPPTGIGGDTYVKGTTLSAGPGMVTLQWNVEVMAVPMLSLPAAAAAGAASLIAFAVWRRRKVA